LFETMGLIPMKNFRYRRAATFSLADGRKATQTVMTADSSEHPGLEWDRENELRYGSGGSGKMARGSESQGGRISRPQGRRLKEDFNDGRGIDAGFGKCGANGASVLETEILL
jgi:hypothetical protein